jgi:AcrR family transcriptional regulator
MPSRTSAADGPPPRKRGYRMSARAITAAATSERILGVAWRLFGELPCDQVTLPDIAAEASVSVPTLHKTFGSKESLLVAAFWRWGQDEASSREVAPVGDVPGAVKILYENYESGGQAILRMLFQEDTVPAMRPLTDAGRHYHRDWVTRTFTPLLAGSRGAARQRRITALVIACDLYTWKLLRLDLKLARKEAERIVCEMIACQSARA